MTTEVLVMVIQETGNRIQQIWIQINETTTNQVETFHFYEEDMS